MPWATSILLILRYKDKRLRKRIDQKLYRSVGTVAQSGYPSVFSTESVSGLRQRVACSSLQSGQAPDPRFDCAGGCRTVPQSPAGCIHHDAPGRSRAVVVLVVFKLCNARPPSTTTRKMSPLAQTSFRKVVDSAVRHRPARRRSSPGTSAHYGNNRQPTFFTLTKTKDFASVERGQTE